MLFKATLENLNRRSMNYDIRKGVPSLYRITDKSKQERVSVGSRAKQLKVVRNTYVDYQRFCTQIGCLEHE